MVKVNNIGSSFAAEITGFQVDNSDEDQKQFIRNCLNKYKVIVIREQTIAPDEFVDFGRAFGIPHQHILKDLCLPDYPLIMPLTNVENPQYTSIYNAANYWHTDQSYDQNPSNCTILHALSVPEVGGRTFICNLELAYKELDEEVKREIDFLQVKHVRDEGEKTNNVPIKDNHTVSRKNTEVFHELVRIHPITGERTLYAIAGTADSIVGVSPKLSTEIFTNLLDHAMKDRYLYKHKYKVGDILVMDTISTIHCAELLDVATCETDTRLLNRISTKLVV